MSFQFAPYKLYHILFGLIREFFEQMRIISFSIQNTVTCCPSLCCTHREGQLTVFRLFVLDHMTGVITMLLMCSASLCRKEYSVVAAVVAEFMLPCLHCSDLFVYHVVVVDSCFFDVKINAFYAPAARP